MASATEPPTDDGSAINISNVSKVVDPNWVADEETPLLAECPHRAADNEDEQEAWHTPSINAWRFGCVNLTFLVMGMNDASVGIEPYYGISYRTVSTLFIVPFFGYVFAAVMNGWLHVTVGQRGIAIMGVVGRLTGYIPMALHPRQFYLLPICMFFTGFGNGVNGSSWNAWVGNLRNTNELLGIIHGAYGVGGILGPLVASYMVSKAGLSWYTYYYVMIGMSTLELVLGASSFWDATGAVYRQRHKIDEDGVAVSAKMILSKPTPWLVALFLFGYVGVEVSLGGWIPTFMIEVRHADSFTAGLVATMFWIGLALGRVVLGFITGRIGEKMAVVAYLFLCAVFQVLYWMVPSVEASAISVAMLGFFLGPLFPAVIVVVTKLLPADQHVATIGLASAIGGSGAALFPFMVGAIAEDSGVGVLQPFILALIGSIALIWLILPGGLRKGGLEKARKERLSM
ncbi:Major Facilitator Superfamily [Geosmithia morbida]|uniref:Major Facilitator Superfamily n=1 Tax=Geosmithia morbida TaxID=1094350 RepID=A0A9P4YSR1_9HYPO|nr:Major Facilitator Superfamily [Geosmithia morbida]KAF4120971.1 Major Facilitator Superfamily [Geosmithia morbida]